MKATVPRLRSAHSHHRRSEPMLALDKHRSSLVPFSWPHYLICAISDLHSKLGRSRLLGYQASPKGKAWFCQDCYAANRQQRKEASKECRLARSMDHAEIVYGH
ncbi:uncharacterized protein [Dermacentor albipictus]|uniref:uncharacterized protein isoform X3 n=1 Tax=Dermacentor albipictus TaxID=60249 RepID=UPI0031FC619A